MPGEKEPGKNGYIRWTTIIPIAVVIMGMGLTWGNTELDKKANLERVVQFEGHVAETIKLTAKETLAETKILVRESEENIKQFMRNEIKELRRALK